nr:putative capsid [Marmot picobirnavirus]
MTDAQLKYRDQEIEKDKVNETKRSNREKERQGRRKLNQDLVLGVGKSVLSVLPGKSNDPSWYNLSKQLVVDAASLSYHTPLGAEPEVLDYRPATSSVLSHSQVANGAIPGIMRIDFFPSCGIDGAPSSNDSVNIAAQNIYSFVRNVNSGARNYQAPDLMMYILTLDSAYMYAATLMRLYSVINTYKADNYYYNRAMLSALGVEEDQEYWRNHAAQLRLTINNYLQRLRTFAVPATMPIFQRHFWLCTNIFKDCDVKRSQEYVFVPEYIYYLLWEDVKLVGFQPNLKDLSTIESDINRITNGIFGNNDIGVMSGDILKAYGENGLISIPEIDSAYHIESVYSPEVLSQINTARLFGVVGNLVLSTGVVTRRYPTIGQVEGSMAIYQGTSADDEGSGTVVGVGNNLFVAINSNATTVNNTMTNLRNYSGKWILNMYKDNPSPDDNMVATRLVFSANRDCYFNSSGVATIRNRIESCGSEVCTQIRIYVLGDGVNGTNGLNVYGPYNHFNSNIVVPDTTTSNTTNWYLRSALLLQHYNKFDWAPRVLVTAISTTYSGVTPTIFETVVYDSLDVKNFVILHTDAIANMNRVAMGSLFALPKLGNKPYSK